MVCFTCDSNPYNALVIVPTTLRNFHEEICKESASSTSLAASLVRPDVHVDNNAFRGEFRFAKPIGKARTAFAMLVPKKGHKCIINHSLHSFQPCKRSDQWAVSPLQSWWLRKVQVKRHRKKKSLENTFKPCVRKILVCWCRCVTASRNPVFIRNHVACSDSEQEWAEHWTTFAMLKENKHLWSLVLVQCFASLANWWFMQQSSSYRSPVLKKGSTCRCQPVTTVRGPFSPQFPFSQRVKSMKGVSFAILRKLELGRHLRPCVGMSFSCWCCCVTATSYQESRCLFRFENEPSIKQLLPCWKNKNLPSFEVLPVLPIEWAFVQQSSPQ